MGTRSGRRRAGAVACALGVSMALGSASAAAFELKHTAHGQPLRWAEASVSYVVDPSVEQAAAGGADAVSSAVHGWSGTGGGPVLSALPGKGGATPRLDGQNTVLFAPGGFAPAGRALAVTVTSYEESTGRIVDADVVVNGLYDFALLDAGTRAKSGAFAISTDGSSQAPSKEADDAAFDLAHVLSHEVGHSLGLADERDDRSALMYAFTMPGDASVRVPSSDDVDGVDAIYGTVTAAGSGGTMPAAGAASHAGCGQASVAGSRSRAADGWGAFTLFAGAGLWFASRRRWRVLRVVLPVATVLAIVLESPDRARSATVISVGRVDAAARVVGVSTRNVGGVFETTIALEPTSCRTGGECPSAARAHAWGGTLDGITQQIGEEAVPRVGDTVDVMFVSDARAITETGLTVAAIVSVR